MKKIFTIWIFAFVVLTGNFVNAQWVQTSGPVTGYSNTLNGNSSYLFTGTNNTGVFRTSDSGTVWTAINTGITSGVLAINSFLINGTDLYAGTYSGLIFKSTDNGNNWNSASTGLPGSAYIQALAASGIDIFAGTDRGIYKSSNGGGLWTQMNTGLTDTSIKALAVRGTTILAGTGNDGVFISTNGGATWSLSITGIYYPYHVNTFGVSGTNIFAGTSGGLFLSTNDGATWTVDTIGLGNHGVHSMAFSGTNVFAGTGSGVKFSSNMGATWTDVSAGLPTGLGPITINVLLAYGSNMYLGTGNNGLGIYKRALSEFTSTGIDEQANDIHVAVYPNPATNQITIAVYNDLVGGRAEITDMLGRKIQISNIEQRRTNIELPNLPAGIYLVRIFNGEKNYSRKIVVQ